MRLFLCFTDEAKIVSVATRHGEVSLLCQHDFSSLSGIGYGFSFIVDKHYRQPQDTR